MILRSPKILFLVLAALLIGCSKDSNPAVPPAPQGDIVSVVERNSPMRVGLVSFTPQKHLFVSISRGTFNCYIGEGFQSFAQGVSGEAFRFTGRDESIEFTRSAAAEGSDLETRIVRVEPAEGIENGYIMIGPSRATLHEYRGKLRLILEGKNVLAINVLPLEEYLLGVVPAEMNPEWPAEALEAQAVVSRTYALFNLKRYDGRGFDVADDERSQRYGGVSVETEATTGAVVDTTNQVVAFENRLAAAVFHAESGGTTASNLDVWPRSGEVEYLQGVSDVLGVVDFSEGGAYEEWSNWASFDELRNALNGDGETYVGRYLSSITILGCSETGRVQSVDILGEKNPVVSGMTFIRVLNWRLREDFLPSNLFTMKVENNGYRFTGSGKGHGVGMSQWGAYQRASNLQGYEFIIAAYFPGCEVIEIPIDGIEVVHNTRVDAIR